MAVGHVKVWAGCKGITPSSTLKWLLFLKRGYFGDELFEWYRHQYIELDFGVGRTIVANRKRKRLLAFLMLLLIVPAVGASIWLGNLAEGAHGTNEMLFLSAMLFLPFIPFALALVLLWDKPPVEVEKLDEQYALLRGAHPSYLAEFTKWDVPLPRQWNAQLRNAR